MMMNPHPSKMFSVRQWLGAALLVLGLQAAIGAPAGIEQRWLLVFNTSSGMKKRLPSVEAEIKTLLTKDFAGALRDGDSIGVWTFDEKLHMGKFPLITWDSKHAGFTASNLVTFVHKESYSGTTSFAALQPTLDSVIQDSDRLTVVIICDGESEIQWTPYNEGMNETLKQTREDRKKIKQPYIIVLRTQMGKYVGATVNFPPLAANVPPFPLLPSEIKAIPRPPPAVVVKPPPAAPPLVIVGTHVSNDTNDLAKLVAANQAAVTVEKSNVAVAAAANPVAMAPAPATVNPVAKPGVLTPYPVTSAPVATVAATVASVVTNAMVATVTNAVTAAMNATDDRDTRILIYVGVALLGAAVVLVIFLIARGRSTPRGSLITTSMTSQPRPPEQK